LKTLDLSFNKLTAFTSSSGLSDKTMLEYLYLNDNELRSIHIYSLDLQIIKLSSNMLSRPPDGLNDLDRSNQLQTLELSQNSLTEIKADSFWNLDILENLILSHNFINSIDNNSFINLNNLQLFDLCNNTIEFLAADVT
jgi:Leucine-rich repeat (LRR) protein